MFANPPQFPITYRRTAITLLAMVVSATSYAEEPTKSGVWSDVQDSLSQTWQSKDYELYIPVNTWHNRSYYSAEKIASFNEQPWGLGLGKYRLDAEGDWHGIYAMAFLDSHSKIEPIVGFGFQKIWSPTDLIHLGLGYTAGVTLRNNSNYLLPIPVVAPLLSIGYKDLAVQSTYIIGGEGNGNVLFTWLRWRLE
jgi:lipid IVA palmitoyltransferase